MRVELFDLVNIMEKDCFVNYLASVLVMYQNKQRKQEHFQPYDIMFTCWDLQMIIKANSGKVKPPMKEWENYLDRGDKARLFEMVCAGKSQEEIDKRAYILIQFNQSIYRVKKELYDRVCAIELEPQVIAENVYKQLTR